MRFVSTRGGSPAIPFSDVLVGALAPDGGLYVPETWPTGCAWPLVNRNYRTVALDVLRQFTGDGVSLEDLAEDIDAAYATFDHPDIAPLVELRPGLYLLELFHGPTLAFKDVALQLLARLMSRELARRNARATILVATSGDTGSAAIAAFGGLPQFTIFVLHPKGRVSEVQRRQMTTSPHANVHNIALEGTFDDAQALVKGLFADREFTTARALTAVNSINFIRIVAQSVYYFTTVAKLGRTARFVVPTGNFGDIFAGDAAARMGVPIGGLVAATNSNDILARALNGGEYAIHRAQATLSPSMDIQVASNFERALFEVSGRDHGWVRAAMDILGHEHRLAISTPMLDGLRSRYTADAVSDAETLQAIREAYDRYGRLIDPHTAVGLAAANRLSTTGTEPAVLLATAHPAKFPETVAKATGMVPPLPPRLQQSYLGEERATVLPPDIDQIRSFIETSTPHEC
jgi:threonine synthase